MKPEYDIQTGIKQPVRSNVQTLRITVLSGGPSAEREVSLASGQAVASALSSLGHQVTVCDIGPDDLGALDVEADVVFVALHGTFGEDGTVQQVMDQRGIVYTGTGCAGSANAMDKLKSKACFADAGLPTPRFDVARPHRISEVLSRWRLPVAIKPLASGSSVGVHRVRNESTFRDALHDVVDRFGCAMVEEWIEGPELTVGIVGDQALPVIEIRSKRGFYDYEAKYIDDATEYHFNIDLPPRLLIRLQEQSLRAAQVLGCRDFCRVDWMVDGITHEPFLLEVNTIPGFTSHSLLPKAAAQAGISFPQLCRRIVDLALARR